MVTYVKYLVHSGCSINANINPLPIFYYSGTIVSMNCLVIFLFHNFDSNIARTFQACMPYVSNCTFLEDQEYTLAASAFPVAYTTILDTEKHSIKICGFPGGCNILKHQS